MARLQRLQLSPPPSRVKNGQPYARQAAACSAPPAESAWTAVARDTGRHADDASRQHERESPAGAVAREGYTPPTRRVRTRHTRRHAGCRDAFLAFDKDRSGTIDVWELRQVLEAMGQKPTEEELFQMISEVDENMSGSIDFAEFLKVIENQKERAENFDDENDMIDAFVACGGEPDKGGHVRRETLVKIIKHDFGLTIDIEELINKIDTDLSGEIEFEEFKALLS
jgi:calmodulin